MYRLKARQQCFLQQAASLCLCAPISRQRMENSLKLKKGSHWRQKHQLFGRPSGPPVWPIL